MAIQIIRTQKEVEALLPVLMNRPVWGFDTETEGLDCHTDKVTLIQLGHEEDQYVIEARKVSIEVLRPFFENPNIRKVAHNAKFDYKMMKGTFNIEVEGLRDTLLGDRIYHNGRKDKFFGLEPVLKWWLDVDLDKTLQKSFIGHKGDYSKEQLEYAAKDVLFLCPLARKMANSLNRDGELAVWQMEGNCIPCFGDMEFRGVKLDVTKWRSLIERNTATAEELRKRMAPFPAEFPHLFRADLFGNVDINYDSPVQILKLLQAMRIRVKNFVKGKEVEGLIEDTNDRTLQKVAQYPFVSLLQEYRGIMKLLTTYGQNFIDAIHPVTGRIHPQFHQIGTATGRPASAGDSPVNMLNIPHTPEIRNCFIADEGNMIQTDDYSGCELRIWAYLSQDPFLLDAFTRGVDVHCHVASRLYGVEVTKKNENKHLRNPVKKLNFGIAYGMGPNKLYTDLNGEGTKISLDETRTLFRNYEKEISVGVNWIREMGRIAAEQGYLANPAGRRRWWLKPNSDDLATFPLGVNDPMYQMKLGNINREGGNFPMQSVNAEMTKSSMIALRQWKKANRVPMEILVNVYDELVTESPASYSPEVVAVKQKIMIDCANRFLSGDPGKRPVPMELENHTLPYWTK